jgi:Ca-activated chloride channel family protein
VQFEFASPWMALLLLAPLAARLFWPRLVREDAPSEQRRETLLHPGLEHLRSSFSVRRPGTAMASRIEGALLLLTWTALTLALMEPQWLEAYTETRQEGYDLMLAVDTSRSMTAEDFSRAGRPVSRMAVLKGQMDEFIVNRSGDRIGLVVFGHQAFVLSPLTYDLAAVRVQLDDVTPGIAGDGTAIGDGLGLAVKKLRERPPGSRVLVLITDGQNDGGLIPPREAARLAAREGIRIYTIGVGSNDEQVRLLAPDYRSYEVAEDLTIDEQLLRQIAETTGGAYFRATDANALSGIYARIDELEKTRAESRTVLIPQPLYAWPLGAAALAWLALGLFPGGRGRRRVGKSNA